MMDKISSVKKGNELEKKVFDLIKELLENDEFFLNSKTSKIFWKKSYFSPERQANIEFDIAIETYLKDSANYSLLTLFECKNYKSSVPVTDIEAFDSKLNQVGEHNTKGYFITNSSFQKGALNLARSKKMGVAILKGNSEFEWLNHRKDTAPLGSTLSIIQNQLTGEESNNRPFFGFVNDTSFESLADMLVELGIIDRYIPNEKYINIPYKSAFDIDNRISELNINKCYEGFKLNTDRLCETVSALYDVNFIFSESLGLSHLSKVLGKIIYDVPEIYITKELEADPLRLRFTLCHEIGHLVLHYNLLKQYFDSTIDTEALFTKQTFSKKTNSNLEIQANKFASQVLLPYYPLINFVRDYFRKNNIYKPHLMLDHQNCNQILVMTLLSEIQWQFQVSKEVARIRLKKMGLLIDNTENSINDIFRRSNLLVMNYS